MSDGLSQIDDTDIERIEGILTCSVDVIAAARQDLEECHAPADSQPLVDLAKRSLSSRPATQRNIASAERRARLRQLLRNPSPDGVTASSRHGIRTPRVDSTSADHIEERVWKTPSFEIPQRQHVRLRRKPTDAIFQQEENEELRQRDRQLIPQRRQRNEKTASPKSSQNGFSSMLMSWTQRMDYLTNVVIGVLATTLVIFLFVRAGQSDPHREVLPVVANTDPGGAQHAIAVASEASLYPAQGFNILPTESREPLPTLAKDVSDLLLLTDPLPTAPGITVLTYMGLPQALPAFPKDIAQLIMIASSPGPDGRDYLIRTLVFETSGETEMGKFAVAHAILNRKRSGRWGGKIADVVTSPWQFEPWMTRKNEIEALSRTDPRYQEAAKIADAVLTGHVPDPTAGATHFLNPVIVRERRGDSLPSWADSNGRPIGRHVFYCPECNGTKPKPAAVAEARKVQPDKATPAAAGSPVKPPRVGPTVVAEAPRDVGTAKAVPAVLRPVAEKPEATSKPKLTTQHQQADLPWLRPKQRRQRRNFVPHAFW